MSISLEQVSKHYDGGPAVSDVSVDIAEGELFVLLGPSGSGKSTLLRAIAGLTPIDHGRVVLHGRDVTHVNAREREVGFVFQNYALFRHMTVADNVEFALRARRVPAAVRRRRRRELLELVSLSGYDDRLPSELSGGQQQRVAVARALAHEPRVLLLDEPFGALDSKIRAELRRGIRELQRKLGITMILVTHDQDEAFTMADRIGIMDRGRLQEVGEPRELYAEPRTRFVATFLGAANLLLGRQEGGRVKVGRSVFELACRPYAHRFGAEVTAVVRPEDLAVAPRGELDAHPIGDGTVTEIEFAGAAERVRISVEAGEALASAVSPAAARFELEALRSAEAARCGALVVGQNIAFGAERVHALPSPISSVRLLASSAADAEKLASAAIVRDLAERMHIAPVRHAERGPDDDQALMGLPVVDLETSKPSLSAAAGLLARGAYQVLAARADALPIARMLIYVQPSRAARDGALSAAATLLRHLAVDATLLVPADDRLRLGSSYRALLDLRSSALRLHGVDLRTETFKGSVGKELERRLESSEEPALVLLGLTSIDAGAALVEEIDALVAARPPAAVLLVCGRAEAAPAFERAESAAAFERAEAAGFRSAGGRTAASRA
ncbi:MAG TPA: ABC transporter ATP-binding protein [Gammaproteobacteria bacterium]|nr:ABC transporter ATP-binding protein [Gammaproteobacteria bacterium]